MFRFGLSFVLKTTHRVQSTEADALRYLNAQFRGPNRLPIPRLYDSFVLDGSTYSLISKIPGKTILEIVETDEVDFPMVCKEIEAVMRRVWALQQPADFNGQVMISASGHGMLTSFDLYAGLRGPYPTRADYYSFFTGLLTGDKLVETLSPAHGDVRSILQADPLVFVHTDLRMQNVLLTADLHLSGIIDWEDAGWLPMERQWHYLQSPHWGSWGYYRLYWEMMDLTAETRKAHEVVRAGIKYLCDLGPGPTVYHEENGPWGGGPFIPFRSSPTLSSWRMG